MHNGVPGITAHGNRQMRRPAHQSQQAILAVEHKPFTSERPPHAGAAGGVAAGVPTNRPRSAPAPRAHQPSPLGPSPTTHRPSPFALRPSPALSPRQAASAQQLLRNERGDDYEAYQRALEQGRAILAAPYSASGQPADAGHASHSCGGSALIGHASSHGSARPRL